MDFIFFCENPVYEWRDPEALDNKQANPSNDKNEQKDSYEFHTISIYELAVWDDVGTFCQTFKVMI